MIIALLSQSLLFSQKIDNTSGLRNLESDRYFRFNYDNDFFASKDNDYTQGYNLELVARFLKKNPINYLFYIPEDAAAKYGLSFEHIGYTADNYESPEIQVGDRPFAAAFMLKSFAAATDNARKQRLSYAFNVGMIGPGAFGRETQEAIHRATGNDNPDGWINQIKNDLVLNYEFGYERQLLRYNDLFSIHSNTNLRLGTLFTNASLGVTGMLGLINDPFDAGTRKNFKLYIYCQPMVNVIGYDATLQGGMFNRESVYTIFEDDIERFTAQNNYGIVLQIRSLVFEYTRTAITREFDGGSSSKWGGLRVGVMF